jgi:hypothetical protein
MQEIERHNLQQIEDLNQRGGRTLSIVDLIEANTLSLDMAAYLLCKVSGGASFLTAARPGGAGKTTLMACLLSFLKPGTRIVAVSDPTCLRSAPADPSRPFCYLAHEIGSGHYHGYIWNEDVSRFLALAQAGHTVASCLHADTLPELTGILVDNLRVPAALLARVHLILFMHVQHGANNGYRRRVATLYETAPGRSGKEDHAHVYKWEPTTDAFVQSAGLNAPERWNAAKDLLRGLRKKGVRDFARVRAEIVGFAGLS